MYYSTSLYVLDRIELMFVKFENTPPNAVLYSFIIIIYSSASSVNIFIILILFSWYTKETLA